MSKESLATKLYNLNGFQELYKPLLVRSVSKQFNKLNSVENSDEIDWSYLLLCGSILAQSSQSAHQDTAYRIAQHCLNSEGTNESHKNAAIVILDSMTNHPSIQLALTKNIINEDYKELLPLPLKLNMISRGMEFSLFDQEKNKLVPINRFQHDVIEGYKHATNLSISAPTSVGKSFILLQIIKMQIVQYSNSIIIYIVPTRSLVQQVLEDVQDLLLVNKIKNTYITAVPVIPKNIEDSNLIFVLTQERLQWLLAESILFTPDLVLVDEAQKIGDGSRGILLQQVIEDIKRRSSESKVIYSSPMTSNPEILLPRSSNGKVNKIIETEQVIVNQNLIWATQVYRKPKKWEVNLCSGLETITLGTLNLPAAVKTDGKRLPTIAYMLGSPSGGNLIYANKPSYAEDMAYVLWDLVGEENETFDEEVKSLISLVKDVIHKDFSLVKVLSRGIAYHYGNMPLIIKNEIEVLFKKGKIKYLVCTSTLIEGMNLPASSIFVRGPRKGIGKPMGEVDFWNLAGRAGRQGKEFQGNIICVDPNKIDVWKNPPPRVRKKYKIKKSVDHVISDADELMDYIERGTPREELSENTELEYGFVYLLGEKIRHGELNKSPLLNQYDRTVLDEINDVISQQMSEVEIPEEIILKHPGISPIAQQELLKFFRSQLLIELFFPIDPYDPEALNRFNSIIEVISTYLSGDHPGATYPHARLVHDWVRGHSLSRIINRNWNYWKGRTDKKKTLATVIRDTMRDIEEYARFKFIKYSSCYNDILKYYVETEVNEGLLNQIPNMNVWLEFGASIETQISLMSLGFTRTTAIAISELMSGDNFTQEACIDWLTININHLGFSPIMMREIEKVVSFYEQIDY
ncbi:DEAD/DEAH box helicase [Peribacillus frigoritolerans]|uniref:DEAD/DEAH box helicase n=1 Tax=Peribacillus frigoritolerans TaxID=450367 RepID=UPI003B8B22D5